MTYTSVTRTIIKIGQFVVRKKFIAVHNYHYIEAIFIVVKYTPYVSSKIRWQSIVTNVYL